MRIKIGNTLTEDREQIEFVAGGGISLGVTENTAGNAFVTITSPSLSSTGDVTITSDSDSSGAGDIVLKTGTNEQLRVAVGGRLQRKNSVLVHQAGHDTADIPAGTV